MGISKRIIAKLGLQKNIKITNKAGEQLGRHKYNTIVIALLAKPKSKIIERALSRAPKKTKIVCRTSHGIRKIFYEETHDAILMRYNKLKVVRAIGDQTISSVLLIKK